MSEGGRMGRGTGAEDVFHAHLQVAGAMTPSNLQARADLGGRNRRGVGQVFDPGLFFQRSLRLPGFAVGLRGDLSSNRSHA